ncbi:hypothetical protein ABEB36_003952 [Hypothenemus hampei]|uniref:Regulator of telomere elongation helicase 1 homolog n=2 Tax=Hypothenemus hampei TaxID=57062 RepID=A0ABD1F1R5_HYPHA
MSVTIDIRGIPVQFPFTPYEIQKNYMEKVIECIQNQTSAVLESPTGTGKTLSLLCSSLAWLQHKKAEIQAHRLTTGAKTVEWLNPEESEVPTFLKGFNSENDCGRNFLGIPTIIYASRTHSQLSQAVQELRNTAYNHMSCSVLGSRDQLCIHPEVLEQENTTTRLHMCRLKLALHSCSYNNRVEKKKDDPLICNVPIIDIEDMVTLGKKHTFCPYYMTKERQKNADIIFTPYNYLLDPIARKSLGLKLNDAIVILDEGHNVEKVCEDSASIDISNKDITVATDEITVVMQMIVECPSTFEESAKQDINPEEVATLKQMLLDFEKALDDIQMPNKADDILHFPGDYMYELMEKAGITVANFPAISNLLDAMIQYLTAQTDNSNMRKGRALQHFLDFLSIVFNAKASKERIRHCYKVHIREEVVKEFKRQNQTRVSNWMEKKDGKTAEKKNRILSFWCFSPGFGMDLIMSQGIRALIITSGTLAPLKPLISELELDVKVRLENPHIVTGSQICVKILPKGPDGITLNSCYRNRDNPEYMNSLGRTIINLTRIIPNGLLIFFPSYPIMEKCQTMWEQEGIWGNIKSQKEIFVEPRSKEAFNAAMKGYYEKIRDPNLKGAIFMGVCRGKVSEGLDFADYNGRAVIITGLPYPPLKDPRVILKRKYLDACHSRDKEYLNGQEWYSLEASRAVNQAIGRVIRHKNDYGAILLLDERFNSPTIKSQLSKWLWDHIKLVNKYGEVIRDISQFFKKAQSEFSVIAMKPSVPPTASFNIPVSYGKNECSASTSSSQCDSSESSTDNEAMLKQYLGTRDNPNGTVALKRDRSEVAARKIQHKKIRLVNYKFKIQESSGNSDVENLDRKIPITEYVLMVLFSVLIFWLFFWW